MVMGVFHLASKKVQNLCLGLHLTYLLGLANPAVCNLLGSRLGQLEGVEVRGTNGTLTAKPARVAGQDVAPTRH
jgi:hypothetical protein